jgi:hypothetical protein
VAGPWARVRPYAPAAFFFGGFLFDAATLGRAVTALDLALLAFYYTAAAGLLLVLGRGVRFRFDRYANWALQFCFGSLCSALTVLYFKSAGSGAAFFFVTLVAALLVGNEYLEERYGELTLALAVFTFCGINYLNFALPHLVRSVRPAWFYISTAAALGVSWGIRRLSPGKRARLGPSAGVAAAIALAFVLNWIPPVPLVRKDLSVCRALDRSRSPYTAQVEEPHLWHFWKRSENRLRWRPDEKIFFYASIFAPAGIEANVAHRWSYRDPGRGWVDETRVPIRLTGGREDGFRTWSFKQKLRPGEWRVACETENGQVIGETKFLVVVVEPAAPIALKTITLH